MVIIGNGVIVYGIVIRVLHPDAIIHDAIGCSVVDDPVVTAIVHADTIMIIVGCSVITYNVVIRVFHPNSIVIIG